MSVVAVGCSAEGPPSPSPSPPTEIDHVADESIGQVRAALTGIVSVNFESAPLGPLGAPWAVTASGASSATIVATADHGRALRLRGGTGASDFLVASLGIASAVSDVNAQVDVRPNPGAAFVWSLEGAGSSIGARRIRLQRAPASNTLVASTSPSGNTDCGPLPSNAWSTITLVVHGQQCMQRTFDVLINGMATSCTGIATSISAPYNAVSVMDASNSGWGGDVLFDNIVVTAP